MEHDSIDKQMSMTNKRGMIQWYWLEKTFNVRKVHYKQFDREKCVKYMTTDLKPTFTPFLIKEHLESPMSCKLFIWELAKIGKKGG